MAAPYPTAAQRVVRRMQRRAVIDLALSLLMLFAFAFLWLAANLPGWFVVLGVLLLIQAIGYMVFAYRIKFKMTAWRRNWLQVTEACAVWSAAVALVTAQISIFFSIGWMVFSCLWIGWMVLIYVRLRRRRSAA